MTVAIAAVDLSVGPVLFDRLPHDRILAPQEIEMATGPESRWSVFVRSERVRSTDRGRALASVYASAGAGGLQRRQTAISAVPHFTALPDGRAAVNGATRRQFRELLDNSRNSVRCESGHVEQLSRRQVVKRAEHAAAEGLAAVPLR
ncbi:MAG: hypothetical protein ACYCWW_10900 [Deltaproteobacteria bacterium]